MRHRGYRDTDGSALLCGLRETVRPLYARFPGWYTGAMTTTRTTALAVLVWLPAIHFSEELPAATLSQGEDVGEGLRTPARGHHPPSHAGRGAPGNAPSAWSLLHLPVGQGRAWGRGRWGPGFALAPLRVSERSGSRGPLQEQSPPSSCLLGCKLASGPESRASVTCELSGAALPRGSGRAVSE